MAGRQYTYTHTRTHLHTPTNTKFSTNYKRITTGNFQRITDTLQEYTLINVDVLVAAEENGLVAKELDEHR